MSTESEIRVALPIMRIAGERSLLELFAESLPERACPKLSELDLSVCLKSLSKPEREAIESEAKWLGCSLSYTET
jgi:hypothetical protein